MSIMYKGQQVAGEPEVDLLLDTDSQNPIANSVVALQFLKYVEGKTVTKEEYALLPAGEKAKDIAYLITNDETSENYQPVITANGVLQGDGAGHITARAVDVNPTLNSTNLVQSGGVKSAINNVFTTTALSSSDNLDNVIQGGVYRWPDSSIPTGSPIATYSKLEVIRKDDSEVVQIVIPGKGEYGVFVRGKYGSWGSWQQLALKNDLIHQTKATYSLSDHPLSVGYNEIIFSASSLSYTAIGISGVQFPSVSTSDKAKLSVAQFLVDGGNLVVGINATAAINYGFLYVYYLY